MVVVDVPSSVGLELAPRVKVVYVLPVMVYLSGSASYMPAGSVTLVPAAVGVVSAAKFPPTVKVIPSKVKTFTICVTVLASSEIVVPALVTVLPGNSDVTVDSTPVGGEPLFPTPPLIVTVVAGRVTVLPA